MKENVTNLHEINILTVGNEKPVIHLDWLTDKNV